MKQDLPDDIKEARRLLDSFDKSIEHSHRTEDFTSAIEILNDYTENNHNSEHLDHIVKIRETYTRKLLQEIPKLMMLDFDDWGTYVFLLLLLRDEVAKLTTDNNPLSHNLNEFISVWRDELIEYIKNTGSMTCYGDLKTFKILIKWRLKDVALDIDAALLIANM